MNKYRKAVIQSYQKKDFIKYLNKAVNNNTINDDFETKEEFFELCLDEVKILKEELFEQYKAEVRPIRIGLSNNETALANVHNDSDSKKKDIELNIIELKNALSQINLDEFRSTFYLRIADEDEPNEIIHLSYSEMTEIETTLHDAINEITQQGLKDNPKTPLHFTCSYTVDELKSIYKGLLDNGYLPTNTSDKAFYYVFGGNGKLEDFEPLQWIKTIKDLNAFINTFFNGKSAKWNKTVSCFLWEGKSINKESLKSAIDSYDKDPDSQIYFDVLKKELKK